MSVDTCGCPTLSSKLVVVHSSLRESVSGYLITCNLNMIIHDY